VKISRKFAGEVLYPDPSTAGDGDTLSRGPYPLGAFGASISSRP